jgi:hypothetical protein
MEKATSEMGFLPEPSFSYGKESLIDPWWQLLKKIPPAEPDFRRELTGLGDLGEETVQSLYGTGHPVGNQKSENGGGQNRDPKCDDQVKNQRSKLLGHELNKQTLRWNPRLPDQGLQEDMASHHKEKHQKKETGGHQCIQCNQCKLEPGINQVLPSIPYRPTRPLRHCF